MPAGPPGTLWASGSTSGLARIKFDAHCQQIRSHGLGCAEAQPAPDVALAERPQPVARVVVVEYVSCAGAPFAVWRGPDLDARTCLDVAHIFGAAPVLSDQPERLPLQSVAHGCAVRLPGASTGRLEQCVAGRPDPEPPREHDRRVDDVSLKWLHDPVLDAGWVPANPHDLPSNRFPGWSSPTWLFEPTIPLYGFAVAPDGDWGGDGEDGEAPGEGL